MSAGVPVVVVKTAKQGQQLCSDIHRFVSRQTVTQGVQSRDQSEIAPLAIVPAKSAHELVDPVLGRAYRGVEIVNGCHGRCASFARFDRLEAHSGNTLVVISAYRRPQRQLVMRPETRF